MTGMSSSEAILLCSQVANTEGLVVTKGGSYGDMIIEKCKSVGQVLYDLAASLLEKLANRVKAIFSSDRLAVDLTGQYIFAKVVRDRPLKERVIAAIKPFFIQELGGAMIGY